MSASKAALNAVSGPEIGKEAKNILIAIVDNEGDPTGALVPAHRGQFCHDTDNDDLYWAHGVTDADWKIMAT